VQSFNFINKTSVMQSEADVDEIVLWAPQTLTLLMTDLMQSSNCGSILFGIKVTAKDINSAYFHIMFNGIVGMTIILDLLATVTKIGIIGDNITEVGSSSSSSNRISTQEYALYAYERQGINVNLEVIPSSSDHRMDIVALDFLFGQYCIYVNNLGSRHSVIDDADQPASPTVDEQEESENKQKPNMVARGMEGSGVVARSALRSSGRVLGKTIRYLGRQYTNASVHMSGPSVTYVGDRTMDAVVEGENEENDINELDVEGHDYDSDDELGSPDSGMRLFSGSDDTRRNSTASVTSSTIGNELVYRTVSEDTLRRRQQRALQMKVGAEGIHAGVRTLTSAVLYPVRWTGRKASKLAMSGNQDQPSTGAKKVMLDTIGGLGNAVASVAKGITEALSEVGSAIGDSTLHHSRVMYGEDYVQQVTKHYVDAWAEVGLAGYKAANVASFGLYGIVLDAIVEGTTLMVCLYDFLVGPVIIQDYITIVQPPFTTSERVYAVLRPWSISFYKNASDFTGKPFKIIPTAMLDTIPKLRVRNDGFHEYMRFEAAVEYMASYKSQTRSDRDVNNLFGQSSVSEENLAKNVVDGVEDDDDIIPAWDTEEITGDDRGFELGTYKRAGSATSNSFDPASPISSLTDQDSLLRYSQQRSNNTATYNKLKPKKKTTILNSLLGGEKTHIELSTVDCSTYLLYPPHKELMLWFAELKSASERVETIKKRKSGADEIAVSRRLKMLPRNNRVYIRFLKLVIAKHVDILNRVCYGHSSNASYPDSATTAEHRGRRGRDRHRAPGNTIYENDADVDEDLDDDILDDDDDDGLSNVIDVDSLHLSIDAIVQTEAQMVPAPTLSFSSNTPAADDDNYDFVVDGENGASQQVGMPSAHILSVNEGSSGAGSTGSRHNDVNSSATSASLTGSDVYIYCPPEHVNDVSDGGCTSLDVPEATALAEMGSDRGDGEASTSVQTGITHGSLAPTTKLTMKRTMHDTIGSLTDPIKNSMLASVRVSYVPVTHTGVKVHEESGLTSFARVGTPVWKDTRHKSDKFLEAEWKELRSSGLLSPTAAQSTSASVTNHAASAASVSAITATPKSAVSASNTVELGYNACLNDSECSYIVLKIEAKTVYGSILELGRAKLRIRTLPTTSAETFDEERCIQWVNVYHKRTSRLVAKLELNAYKIVVG
jgi:hypothetical protein